MGVTSLLTAVGSLLAGYLTEQSVGTYGKYAVATDTPLCSKIGTDRLKANGSAVDAAIAAMFCLGVVSMQKMKKMKMNGANFLTCSQGLNCGGTREVRSDVSILRRLWQPLQSIEITPHPPRPTTAQIEIDHNTGHYVPYSLRTVRAFFYVPQFYL